MRVALVGHDMAPSNAFTELAKVLDNPKVLLAHAKKENIPSNATIAEAVRGADFVLCGISQPEENALMEIAAAREALRLGIPIGFYADATGAWRRESITQFRSNAALILTILGGEEVGDAKGMFPNALVINSGNPMWEQYFLPANREQARELAGAKESDFVVLSPGTKEPVLTIHLWAAVLEAMSMMIEGGDRVAVLTQHPGDQTPPEIYKLLSDFAEDLGVRLVGPGKMQSDEYIPGVDAVVANMNSSVAVHAISRRIGVVDFYGPLAQTRLQRGGAGRFGQHHETGAVLDIYTASSEDLADALDKLANDPAMLRPDQERVHPVLRQGDSVANMKAAIEKVLRK